MHKLIGIVCIIICIGFVPASNAQNNAHTAQHVSGIDNAKTGTQNLFTLSGLSQYVQKIDAKGIQSASMPGVTKSSLIINSVLASSNALIERLTGIQFKYAMMLNVDVESLKNLSLLGLIDRWFGVRYKMGGTTKKGIDCSALTSTLLLAIYGLELPRTARQQYNATEHIYKEDLKQGDLVFFNTHGGVSHVGVYIANNYFVHASSSHGVTISNLDEAYYARRFICGGRPEED